VRQYSFESTLLMMEESKKREHRIVFLGPPGAGKGTQAAYLKRDEGNICHLATGDMLRAAIAAQSELGKRVKSIVENGELVPDEIMIQLIKDNITQPECKQGFILDGFPRTIHQAEKLDTMLKEDKKQLSAAFEFAMDDELLVSRITGRLIHPPSGRTYHTKYHPPRVPNKDDVSGEDLVRRPDDNEATLRKRLTTYHLQTKPLRDYYQKQSILTTLDASQSSRVVYAWIRKALFLPPTPEKAA